ncbi:MAG: 2-C-methyl-D-erythritol 4-phosphate cytidylyltransferase [Clostridia bacterium]|nr:2-C-methyl-D-erythritol 4-phosphate cytidylyltransferase [Clostridia bacterium]
MIEKKLEAVNGVVDAFTKHRTAAVILAAGSSTRMGKDKNKQFEMLCGMPVLAHTLLAYEHCVLIQEIVIVARPQDFPAITKLCKVCRITKLRALAVGGRTRQESAYSGVRRVSPFAKYVAIADGARCLTTPEQIARVCIRAYRHKAAAAAHKVSDTVKRTNTLGAVRETVSRENLWQAQTPQVFHTSLYLAAQYRAKADGFEATDDCSLIENLGYKVQLVECGMENLKITTPDDLDIAEAILSHRRAKK